LVLVAVLAGSAIARAADGKPNILII